MNDDAKMKEVSTNPQEKSFAPPESDDLAALIARAASGKGLPPVERWNPPFCGAIDMRIDREGRWHYCGSPIGREAMVRLFSTVLRRDGEDYFLVTPVERVQISVEDVPFIAVELVQEAGKLVFRTNVGDVVTAGPENPLRFATDRENDGLKPYLLVRGGLEARLSRAVTYQLVDLAEEHDGGRMSVSSGESRFYLPDPGA